MLKRKLYQSVLDWKKKKDKECLLIKGARQIGKTYLIEEIGKNEYQHFIEINFEQRPELRHIFDGDLSVEELVKKISLSIPTARFVEGNTLLLLDEIQSCPQARTSLKFWASDNRYDVIATGSLLGVNYKEVSSFPVGYERQVMMHSLDFEEFLWAIGVGEDVLDYLKRFLKNYDCVDSSVHNQMMRYLHEYLVVGGMPAVVNKFIETNNFGEVHIEQEKLVQSYLNDIAKYAPNSDKPKARNCFLSLPRQLAKENTKFQYSVVEKGGTARKYGNSLDWLKDANIITFCNNVTTPKFPLVAYLKPEQFRIYANDIGLLVSMYGFDMKKALVEDTLVGDTKGGIYENLVADMLIKRNIPLRYYSREDSSLEIEFLIEKDACVVPVEVKSKRGKTTSLDSILKHEDIRYGFKFSAGNVGKEGKKISLPFYMIPFVL